MNTDILPVDADEDVELPLIAPPVSEELLKAAASIQQSEDEIEREEHFNALAAEREKRMPSLATLKPGIDAEGNFIPVAGESVVIERRASTLDGMPWLDTRVFRVLAVNAETGVVRLFDDDIKQHAMTNFRTASMLCFNFKIPAKRGNPFGPQNLEPEKLAIAIAVAASTQGDEPIKKKGRGRPTGSKNRERTVIIAEKQARQADRKAKVTRRRKK